jgi:hypothetical protein
MQFDTNSNKSSQKNVLRRARRSKEHRTDASNVKKNQNHQKANYSKNSSCQSSKRRVRSDRERSKNVKARQMSKESCNVVQINYAFFRRQNDIMTFIKKTRIQCLIDFFFLSLVAANFDDIVESAYSKSIDFLEIIENEISQTIVKIVSNIVSKENDIFHRVIKFAFSHVMSVIK